MTLPGIHKSVFFASSDSSLITMDGSTIRRWGYGAFRSIPPIAGFPSPPLGGRVSPDAKSVYLIGSDYEIQFWDLATSKLRAHQVAHGALPNAVAFSRDSKRFATAGEDQTARLWNVETGSPMHLPLRHQGPVVAIDFRADGNQLITASLDKTAIIWDVTTGKAVGSPLIHPGPVYASVFSPDGKIVATSSDTNAYLWDASTGKPFAKPLSHAQSINQVQFNPNGKYLLTTAADHIVRIWDVETGQIHRQFACDSMIIRADFSPDGARIAVTTSGRFARVWDVATGQALTPLLPHRSFLWNPIFSQDGNIIITRQDDSSPPIVRDAGNGRQIGPALQTFWSNVTVAFSPDNQAILTCNNNALARRWPVPNPMDGDDQTIMGTFERATGLRLTDTNIARVLTADEWKALPQK
jgi:WD40 repeat protein